LPELLDRAHSGKPTIVKKRGVPYAAIVALDQHVITQREGLLSLRATGSIFNRDESKQATGVNSNVPCFLLTTSLEIDTFYQKTTTTPGVS